MTNTDKQPEPSEEFKRDVESAIVNELVRKIVEVEFAKPEVMARLNAAVMDVVNKPPTGGVVRPAVQPLRKVPLEFDDNKVRACRACEAKDRELADRAKLLDEKHFNLIEVKKERDAIAGRLDDEVKSRIHYATLAGKRGDEILSLKLELDKWRKEHSRREQEIESLKRVGVVTPNYFDLRRSLERESAEHFATRVRLRDALRAAGQYARMTRDYARQKDHLHLGAAANEDAAQFEAAREVLGLDTISMPPKMGETAEHTSRELGASKLRVRDITPDASTASEMARLFDEQVMGYVETKGEPAQQPAQQPAPEPARRRRFLAGDRVRPAAQEIVYSAVLDEDDSGSVAIQIGSRKYLNVGASALELIEATTPAKRNSEFAFHFHIWHLNIEPGSMDSVPEFVRVAAEQLMRDPFGTEYGSVLADAKTGGAK